MHLVNWHRNSREQGWSPTSRGDLAGVRDEAPYLMRVEIGPNGTRAVILDYGIKQGDGTWRLASDPATSYATKADITALAHAPGTPDQGPGQASWRVEDIQANPYANLPVEIANPKVTQKLHQGIPEKRRSGQMSRCAAACNDNGAWPGQPFIFSSVGGRIAA